MCEIRNFISSHFTPRFFVIKEIRFGNIRINFFIIFLTASFSLFKSHQKIIVTYLHMLDDKSIHKNILTFKKNIQRPSYVLFLLRPCIIICIAKLYYSAVLLNNKNLFLYLINSSEISQGNYILQALFLFMITFIIEQ